MDARARVEKRVVFPVGRREVWAALTRPDELSSWFGIDVVSLELRPAGRIVFRGADGASRRALVEIVDEPARFAFRWLPALAGGRFDRSPGSRVEFVLKEVPEGTALTVVEAPWVLVGEIVRMAAPVIVEGTLPDPLGAPPRITMLA